MTDTYRPQGTAVSLPSLLLDVIKRKVNMIIVQDISSSAPSLIIMYIYIFNTNKVFS